MGAGLAAAGAGAEEGTEELARGVVRFLGCTAVWRCPLPCGAEEGLGAGTTRVVVADSSGAAEVGGGGEGAGECTTEDAGDGAVFAGEDAAVAGEGPEDRDAGVLRFAACCSLERMGRFLELSLGAECAPMSS